jgi:hypothetical protein
MCTLTMMHCIATHLKAMGPADYELATQNPWPPKPFLFTI